MSRGTINGDVLNAFAINAGQVTHEASAAVAMVLGSAIRFSQIHSARAAQSASFAHVALARRRQLLRATAAAVFSNTAVARRRTGLVSASGLTLAHVAAATRRAQFAANAPIVFGGSAGLFWRYRQRAPRERVVTVPLDQSSRLFTSRGP